MEEFNLDTRILLTDCTLYKAVVGAGSEDSKEVRGLLDLGDIKSSSRSVSINWL